MSDVEPGEGPVRLDAKAAAMASRWPTVTEPERQQRQQDPEAVARARATLARRQVPERFVDAEVGDAPAELAERLNAWVRQPVRPNLVLVGSAGRGKSHLAAAAVMAAYRLHGEAAAFRWTTVAALMERSRPEGDDDGGPSLSMLRQIGVAVLDDLGAERASDWTAERLALLIDQRWSAGKPLVVTSNLGLGPDGALAQHVGERAYSRLVGDGALVLTLAGIDRRRGR